MKKTILITGATDGIGLETAKLLFQKSHHLLIHGRSATKMAELESSLSALSGGGSFESYLADMSQLNEVDAMAKAIIDKHDTLDVLINNAGVFKMANPVTHNGLDARFVVNTFAPYKLTNQLLPLIGAGGRVVNLSSAAQATVNIEAMTGKTKLADMDAYAQSKLAITMWSIDLAGQTEAPVVIAVNPGSLLATKMVKEGFGTAGNDIGIGANILCRAALDDEFAKASGQYFDNDRGQFGPPHPDALDANKREIVVNAIGSVVNQIT